MPVKYVVTIGGTDVATVAPIDYIETYSGVNKIPYAIVRVKDWLEAGTDKTLLLDETYFKVGSDVTIELGTADSTTKVFTGIVVRQSLKMDAEHGSCYLEIVAKDKANYLTLANHIASYQDKTDDDILKDIITGQGLTADVSGMSVTHENFVQCNMTDWDLINVRAESYGRVVVVSEGKVSIVAPASASGSPTITFGDNMVSMDLELNSECQLNSIAGKRWDVASQAVADVSGDSVAEQSFGSIGYADATKAMNNQTSTYALSYALDETELKNVITGNLTLNRFAKIQGHVVIEGDASVAINTCVALEKGSALFQGNAYVSGVKHYVDKEGWFTKIFIGLSGKRYSKRNNSIFGPSNGVISEMSGLYVGKVKKLADEDPNKENRLFVYIPTLHADTSSGVWCRFASPYASNAFGMLFMPEKEDEVVVGFFDADPRHGVILGSLYSSKMAPPETLAADNYYKEIKTKEGMLLKFDEEKKVITLSTPGGGSVTISDDAKSIECAYGSNQISMVDGAITLKGSGDISIEGANVSIKANQKIALAASGGDLSGSGTNVKLSANASAEISGSATAKLTSSGQTVVKGTIVNIN